MVIPILSIMQYYSVSGIYDISRQNTFKYGMVLKIHIGKSVPK